MWHINNIDETIKDKGKYPADKTFLKALEYNTDYFSQAIGCVTKGMFQFANDCLILRTGGYHITKNALAIIHIDGIPSIVEIEQTKANMLLNILNGSDAGKYTLVKKDETTTIIGEDGIEYKDVLKKDVYFPRLAGNGETVYNFYEWTHDLFVKRKDSVWNTVNLAGLHYYTVITTGFIRTDPGFLKTGQILLIGYVRDDITNLIEGNSYRAITEILSNDIKRLGLTRGSAPLPMHAYIGLDNIYDANFVIGERNGLLYGEVNINVRKGSIDKDSNFIISGTFPLY
jgi:hypothetical protein